MGSNLLNLDDIAIIVNRMTADEILEVLGITIEEMLEYLPAGSVEALKDYLDND